MKFSLLQQRKFLQRARVVWPRVETDWGREQEKERSSEQRQRQTNEEKGLQRGGKDTGSDCED